MRVLHVSRAITVVHLLTNSQWGEGIPPTKFLSCRQSAPARDKSATVGDSSVSKLTQQEIQQVRNRIRIESARNSCACDLVESLNAAKFLSMVDCNENGPRIIVDLVPSLNPDGVGSGIAVCSISIRNIPVMVLYHPLLQDLVRHNSRLVILINNDTVLNSQTSRDPVISTGTQDVIRELSFAQEVALDYMIIDRLHHEVESGSKSGNWTIVNRSRYTSDLEISAVKVLSEKSSKLTVRLQAEVVDQSPAVHTALNSLRSSFIEWRMQKNGKSFLLEILMSLADIVTT